MTASLRKMCGNSNAIARFVKKFSKDKVERCYLYFIYLSGLEEQFNLFNRLIDSQMANGIIFYLHNNTNINKL